MCWMITTPSLIDERRNKNSLDIDYSVRQILTPASEHEEEKSKGPVNGALFL